MILSLIPKTVSARRLCSDRKIQYLWCIGIALVLLWVFSFIKLNKYFTSKQCVQSVYSLSSDLAMVCFLWKQFIQFVISCGSEVGKALLGNLTRFKLKLFDGRRSSKIYHFRVSPFECRFTRCSGASKRAKSNLPWVCNSCVEEVWCLCSHHLQW